MGGSTVDLAAGCIRVELVLVERELGVCAHPPDPEETHPEIRREVSRDDLQRTRPRRLDGQHATEQLSREPSSGLQCERAVVIATHIVRANGEVAGEGRVVEAAVCHLNRSRKVARCKFQPGIPGWKPFSSVCVACPSNRGAGVGTSTAVAGAPSAGTSIVLGGGLLCAPVAAICTFLISTVPFAEPPCIRSGW